MRPTAPLTRSRPSSPAALRAAALTVAPALVRGLTSAQMQRGTRALLDMVRRRDRLERLPLLFADNGRHPLAPAAVRVERSHGRDTEQTAVTVWFQEGPSLPAFAAGGAPRHTGLGGWRLGAGLLGVAAVAAAGAAARLQAAQPRVRVIDDTLASGSSPV